MKKSFECSNCEEEFTVDVDEVDEITCECGAGFEDLYAVENDIPEELDFGEE